MKISLNSVLGLGLALVNLLLFTIDFGNNLIILIPVDFLFLFVFENTGSDDPGELDFSLVRLTAVIWLVTAVLTAFISILTFDFPANFIWAVVGAMFNLFFADRFYKFSIKVSNSLETKSIAVTA